MRIAAFLLLPSLCAFAACAPHTGIRTGTDEAGGVAGTGDAAAAAGSAARRHAAIFAGADIAVAAVAAGVTHTVVRDSAGPWTIHLVEVDAALCRPVLEARKAPGRVSSLAPTSELGADAVVAINADFFRAPGGTPVGAYVERGVPHIGPTEWPLLGFDAGGGWTHGRGRLDGHVVTRTDTAALTQINRQATSFTAYQGTADGVALHTARSDTVPADSAARRILLRLLQGDEAAGSAVVMAVDSPAAAVLVEAGRGALLVRGAAAGWGARRASGDTVHWQARVMVHDGLVEREAAEAVGGFPALLSGGRDVLGLQAVRRAFGDARHPRTAVGWNADRLWLVVVDGRQEHSDGMTLPELVALFRRLGAEEAVNLDGGGSTALVVRGMLVNQPSDDEGERPVGNALALARCRP